LELNHQRDDLFIQLLCRGLCGALRLRFGHATDATLDYLRSDAQSPKHLDPEGPVPASVQMLEANRYENDSSGGGVHIASSRPTSGIGRSASRASLRWIESRVQSFVLLRKEGQLSVQYEKAAEWFLVRGFRAVRDAFLCRDQSRR
jgi:hypothetical protein